MATTEGSEARVRIVSPAHSCNFGNEAPGVAPGTATAGISCNAQSGRLVQPQSISGCSWVLRSVGGTRNIQVWFGKDGLARWLVREFAPRVKHRRTKSIQPHLRRCRFTVDPTRLKGAFKN